MGSKFSAQITGFRYSMGLHMGLSRGPIDEIVEIRVGDLRAWPKVSTEYKAVNTFDTVADMYASDKTSAPNDVSWVTEDPDPTKDGYYRRAGSGWTYIGSSLTSAAITDTGITTIDSPQLFGGDDKEGGVQGTLSVMMGKPDQVCDPTLAGLLGGIVSGFRGAATAFFNGLVCSMNPYPKAWAFRLRRATKGWYNDNAWYPEKSIITLMGFQGDGGDPTQTADDYTDPVIKAMNPAHIIAQCATDPQWGRGLDFEQLNLASFRNSADALYTEGFGLCMKWVQGDDIDVFVQSVCDHIGAAVYVDRGTGLLTMSLIRADYDPKEIPTFTTENGLISIDDDESSSQDSGYNEVVVNFTEAVTGKTASINAQNLASFRATGNLNSTTSEYPGIPNKDLAARVALRDVMIQSVGLKKFKVVLNRKAWRIAPGSVFAVADPKRNIGNLILRAFNVEDGSDTSGTITISATVDVFGLPSESYVVAQKSAWVAPPRSPQPPTVFKVCEVPYRDIVRNLTPADLASITEDESFIMSMVEAPNGLSLSYDLMTKATGETAYAEHGAGAFCPAAVLAAAIGAYDTSCTLTSFIGFDRDDVGSTMMIGNEIIRVDAFDSSTGICTIARGCADTIPAAHAVSAVAWWYENEIVEDSRSYSNTEVISAKFLTLTSAGQSDISVSPTGTQTIKLRQPRPYPPGKVRLNDGVTDHKVYDLTSADVFTGDFTIKWTGRDRITQADQLIDESQNTVGPETGVTYTIRVYGDDGVTLVRTEAAVTSPYTYDSTKQIADGDLRHPTFQLVSVRDGLESYFPHRFIVWRNSAGGWGDDWGFNWGN